MRKGRRDPVHASRQDAKTQSSENPREIFNFAALRLGEINVSAVLFSDIFKARL
jgi:hypothetical protein